MYVLTLALFILLTSLSDIYAQRVKSKISNELGLMYTSHFALEDGKQSAVAVLRCCFTVLPVL